MNNVILKSFMLIVILLAISCSSNKISQKPKIIDNQLINKLYLKDIEIREIDAKSDTVILESYDKKHREKIFQLLAENKVITAMDKFRAAWILQHTAGKFCDGELTSISPENFLLAYKLSSEALSILQKEKDTATLNKGHVQRMVALNYDRYLLYTLGYQKFGTQFVFDDKTNEMLLAPIDTSLSNDEERAKYFVEPMKIILKNHKIKPLTNRE